MISAFRPRGLPKSSRSRLPHNPTSSLRRQLATETSIPKKDYAALTPPYPHLITQLSKVREILGRPLSLAEKIVYSHLVNVEESLSPWKGKDLRGNADLLLRPDRVAMQGKLVQLSSILFSRLHPTGHLFFELLDASAQMALLQFATCGSETTAVPTSIHCDHLVSAFEGAEADLKRSIVTNKEVFDFLESA
jgi:aconitase A